VANKSGLDGPATGSELTGSRVGAAFTFNEDEAFKPAFFRFTDVGTKAVASFFRSRNCGATESVASAEIGKVGFGGWEEWADRESRWAWKV
jgi:hypothetical protein